MLAFNPIVLNKVVKTMTPQKERVEEAQIRGTIVFSANEHFVRLDGASGDSLTPIANFAEGASDAGFVHGDRVLVLIKNHQAIVTKNLTTGLQAQAAKEAGGFVTVITDEGITAQRIIANDTFTNTLRANEITADEIIAGMATIDQLDANYAHITNGVIDNATIGHADVNDLDANYAHITSGVIDNATIDQANVNNLGANYAHITNGVIDNAKIGYADVNNLNANYAHITNGVIDNAKIGYADVDHLDAHYAEIDLANVNNAWIEYGAMKKAEVFDENVFDLSGDHATIKRIDASKINVANLRADNLIVRRINGQPVVGGYTLIDSNSSGYASKNPQALGWYEFVNAQWVLSTDTTVDLTKAYYQTGNEVSLYDQAYIDGLENDLQQQIDGAVETFTGSVVPTLVNWPYTDWYDTSVTPVHDERAKHVGDIYYVVNSAADENGYCYRFAYDNTTHAYSWVLIKDSDVTKALSDISDLQAFESTTTSWIDETDEGLETIRTNHTALSGVVDKTVKESVQLWFTKANTTAPNKPTAEVTSTSTAGNAWRKVVPAYNASYPNYYYCWQYKFVDDTFGWSDVVRDIAMGETQGVSRDAKNTADAALPASTFETFESTTFTDLVDEVDEQSTTMTNMTTRLGLNADGTQSATDIVAKESALEQTVDGISTRVGKTETKLIGMYATSSTAAGTAAKVATITPTLPSGATWELGTGTIITVKFTNANTTSSPTLNVNSKGAKAIKTYANGNLSEAEYKWAAGSTFTFVYNGTNWLMQDSSVSVRMNSNETSISQTADSIISLASGNTTYTKPDGTTATSTIGTTVNQTANNVLIKATRTGATTAEQQAGGTSAAALINVTPDTVKIAANHVEIDGTAVFNAVSDSSTASAAMLNSEIEIGGRNLHKLSDSLASSAWVFNNGTNSGGTVTLTAPSPITETRIYQMPADGYWTWEPSTEYVASIEAKGNAGGESLLVVCNGGGTVTYYDENPTLTTSWKRYSRAFKTSSSVSTGSMSYYLTTAGATIQLRNPKLEKGNKSTDWTPAPEDVQAEIDAKKSTHTLLSSNTEGTSYANLLDWCKEGATGGWNVQSATGVKVGDTVRIGYPISDMGTAGNRPIAYCVGTVTSVNSATNISIISHGLDTTIIDGGNILTNSIGANQIAANAIDTTKLTVGAQADMLNSNIEVGGRNLHKDSANFVSGWTTENATVSNGVCTISLAGTGNRRIYQMPADGYWEIWKANTTYTVSVDAKTDTTGAQLSFQPYANGVGAKNVNLTTEWKRYSYTFTSGSNTSTSSCTYLATNGSSGNVLIRNPKLEYGNVATDWTPAPEDASQYVYLTSSYNVNETQLTTWSAEGHDAGNWTVSSNAGVKVGDTVAIKATRALTSEVVYFIIAVTSLSGTTIVKGISHGFIEPSASKTATTYITKIDDAGIFISPSNQNPTSTAAGNSVRINDSGMFIYQGGIERAYFKADAAAIGTNGGNRSIMNSTGLHVYQLINSTQTEVATFGADATVGPTSGYNTFIDSDTGVLLRKGTTSVGKFVQSGASSKTRTVGVYKALSSGGSYTHSALSSATGVISALATLINSSGSRRNTIIQFTKGTSATKAGLTYNGSTMFTNASGSGYTSIIIRNLQYTISEVSSQLIVGNTTSYGNNALTIGQSGADPVFEIDSAGNVDVKGNISAWNLGNTNISGTTGQTVTGVSVGSSSSTQIDSFVLAPGVWIIAWTMNFSGNSSGVRYGNIAQTSGSTWQYTKNNASSSGISVLSATQIVAPTASNGTTYYLNAWQNSGSTLTVSAEIFMVQIS